MHERSGRNVNRETLRSDVHIPVAGFLSAGPSRQPWFSDCPAKALLLQRWRIWPDVHHQAFHRGWLTGNPRERFCNSAICYDPRVVKTKMFFMTPLLSLSASAPGLVFFRAQLNSELSVLKYKGVLNIKFVSQGYSTGVTFLRGKGLNGAVLHWVMTSQQSEKTWLGVTPLKGKEWATARSQERWLRLTWQITIFWCLKHTHGSQLHALKAPANVIDPKDVRGRTRLMSVPIQ